MSISTASRTLLAALALGICVLAPASTASAHSDIEQSSPAVDEVVGEPVGEIRVVFVSAATPDADGFEVLDPQGEVRTPDVEQVDDRTYLLRLSPALGGGEAAVRYSMVAADGHALTGGFSFVVDAPVPVSTTVAPTTVPAASPDTTPTSSTATTLAPAVGSDETESSTGTVDASAADVGDADDATGLDGDVIGVLALATAGGLGAGFARWRARTPVS